MTTLKELKENKKTHISKAREGDLIKVGIEGSRTKHLHRVSKVTKSGIVKVVSGMHQFDPKTGFAKGTKQKVFATVATPKDKDAPILGRVLLKH